MKNIYNSKFIYLFTIFVSFFLKYNSQTVLFNETFESWGNSTYTSDVTMLIAMNPHGNIGKLMMVTVFLLVLMLMLPVMVELIVHHHQWR